MNDLSIHLQRALAEGPQAKRYWVGFSGGADSTALLYLMAEVVGDGVPLLSVHVDHGLHPDAATWADHCKNVANSLGVEHFHRSVTLGASKGESLENQARDARYEVFDRCLKTGDVLLTAHHLEDQQETLLMRLFRGAGTRGLAGIPRIRAVGRGHVYRPFLDVSGAGLQAYVVQRGLDYISDTSNQDLRFDRNYVRHSVLPTIGSRWSLSGLNRAAVHARESSDLLDEIAQQDIDLITTEGAMSISRLSALSQKRQVNALRFWIANLGFELPSTARLKSIFDDVLRADQDACPSVYWANVVLRRYRDHLILETCTPEMSAKPLIWESFEQPLAIGEGLLSAVPDQNSGLDLGKIKFPLTVSYRQGGERIKAFPGTRHRELKKLFQEKGVFPWMRDRIPLVYSGDHLLYVGDLYFSSDFAVGSGQSGVRLSWQGHPGLFL